MPVDELGQRFGLFAVVQQVAADDHVEQAEPGIRARPVAGRIFHGRQRVEPKVLQQESGGQWMAVTGGDVPAAPVNHQAGQAQAATHLQDTLAIEFEGQHGLRQHPAQRARAGRTAAIAPRKCLRARPRPQGRGIAADPATSGVSNRRLRR
jgi:hypothetical protein